MSNGLVFQQFADNSSQYTSIE